MKIYLSPSTQKYNLDVDGVSETTTMNYIADALEPYLRINAIEFTRNNPSQTVSQIIAESNAGNYDLHLAIHSNAAPAPSSGQVRGSRMYYYPTSESGKRFAEIIAQNMKNIYPLPDKVATFPDNTLAELKNTRAPAVIVETAFHDNAEDSRWIKENIQNIARILAESLSEYNGRRFIPVCMSGTTPASQFAFRGITYGVVCNITSVLNVRREPSTASPVAAQLRNGTPVVVIGGNENGWTHIRVNNTEGYVSSPFLCICNTPAVTDNSRLGTVMTPRGGSLNIRRQAALTSPVVATAPQGAQLIVLGESGSFYNVDYQGVGGYAWKNYIYI